MKIRTLERTDVPRMVMLGYEFYDEGNLPGEFLPSEFMGNWMQFLDTGLGILVGAENDVGDLIGVVGGVMTPDQCDGRWVAHEMFWFVTAKERCSSAGLRLLNAFEAESANRGAARVDMALLADRVGEKLDAHLKRKGYRPTETHYIKDLEG